MPVIVKVVDVSIKGGLAFISSPSIVRRYEAVLQPGAWMAAKWRIGVAFILLTVVITLFGFMQGATPASAQAGGGEDAEERIIGGTDVPDGKYRFMAALLDKRFGGSAWNQQFCGGSLIDMNTVLTAAHCVDGNVATNLQVTVGRTVLDSTQGQVRDVTAINIHPSWNSSTFANDVAVLQLSSPVTGIKPLKLPSTSQNSFEKPGRSLTVAGWGNTTAQPASGPSPGSSFPQRMREAEVPVVSDSTAAGKYSNYVSPLMVAAGKTGKDTCQGDSGGPMFEKVKTSTGATVYYQVGITSFGVGCGAPGWPGVYAEVNNSNLRNFITSTAASNN
jgi:trypsin